MDASEHPAEPVEIALRVSADEAILEALGDPVARRLLLALATEEHDVHALVVRTGLPQSSVYRKIQALEIAGLVRVSRLAFTTEGKKVEVYRSRLREVRIRLAGGLIRVDVEPVEDGADRIGRMWQQVRKRER